MFATLFATAIRLAGAGGFVVAEEAPRLDLPIQCRPSEDCWVVNLVDLDAGPGVRDYACGAHSYNGHKGTDFAIRDERQMRKGVPVVATAAGTVTARRDGMRDIDVGVIGLHRVKDVECGNGVVLDHGGGWETQYCHLRKGSIVVKKGQKVGRGARIGMVCMSRMAEFPHVHLSVRHEGRVVDPFIGSGETGGGKSCGGKRKPMWVAEQLKALSGPRSALYAIGFAAKPPTARAARAGRHADAALPRNAPVLVLWVDAFWVSAGDQVTLTITGPGGETVHRYTSRVKKDRARQFLFSGIRKKALF